MGEYKRYSYTGPQYYYGNKIAEKSNLYTMAKSWEQARNNFLYKIANGDKPYYYDIVDSHIKLILHTKEPKDNYVIKKCEVCGTQLNSFDECPVCDYGEYDLLE